jgi:hypothetical protein
MRCSATVVIGDQAAEASVEVREVYASGAGGRATKSCTNAT